MGSDQQERPAAEHGSRAASGPRTVPGEGATGNQPGTAAPAPDGRAGSDHGAATFRSRLLAGAAGIAGRRQSAAPDRSRRDDARGEPGKVAAAEQAPPDPAPSAGC